MSNFGPLRSAVAFLGLLVLAVLAVPDAASADPVLYTFSTTATIGVENVTSSFSFEVPDIITAVGLTTITNLLSKSNTGDFWATSHCGGSVPLTTVLLDNPASDLLTIVENNSVCGVAFNFAGPVDTFGTFIGMDGISTLTISQTPEPSTVLLFGSGLLLFGMIGGRKRLHAAELSA